MPEANFSCERSNDRFPFGDGIEEVVDRMMFKFYPDFEWISF